MIARPTLPAPLFVYEEFTGFLDAISGLNLDMPFSAPIRAEVDPTLALLRGVTLDRLIAWLRANLHSPAHLLPAEAPECGERHQLEFEDILDGEAFRLAWRHVCEPFGADLTPSRGR